MVLMVMMIRKLPSKCYDEFANLLSVEEVGIKRGEGGRPPFIYRRKERIHLVYLN